MRSASSVMANKKFAYLILASFVAGTILLLVIQYNFSQNMQSMRKGNESLLRELHTSNHLREIDRDLLGVEARIRAAIATDDTSHLEGVDAKIKAVKDYLDSLRGRNHNAKVKQYLERLNILADEKVRIKNELLNHYHKTGNMNDTSFIANPRARRISNEITDVTHKIYDNRQKMMDELSVAVIDNSSKARMYGNILMVFMFLSGGTLCWFIVNQFRQQNRLINRLNESEKTAREALLIKENFLANMSHEIRTPLNAILGFTNLLKRRKIDVDADEFVGSIQKAGENLMAIINDILDLSKIEAGMMRIVHSPFSVRGLIDSIETLFNERIKEKGLAFNSNIASDVPDTLIGDATRLTQILVNLIGNAMKFSEYGCIRVEVYNKQVTDKTIKLGIRVADDGIGIQKDKLASIFERFNQAEDSITRSYGGTGLGLSIVKDLVVLQLGEIEVSSEPGKGTEFNFYIPYTIADEQLTGHVNDDVIDLKPKVSHDLNILVVDDNIMNQSLMKHMLTQWDVGFDVVSNGEEAINKLQSEVYNVVLMDIQMPKMDGYTATYHIRNDLELDIPVIAMTAHAMAGEREKCLSHGMNEYIAKPVNDDDLFKLILKFVPGASRPEQPAAINEYTYQYIDLNYMKDISKGNAAYEKLVTSQFIELTLADVNTLKNMFSAEDFAGLKSTAHNMKTTVAIMGLLPALEADLDELEQATTADTETLRLINDITGVCLNAIDDAKHFYGTLV
ncbi:ATP-binding protein [Mucilaginibacter sp. SMC90]|uniref:ATP-binding protein n=1 Tax=Mucilaginibacter sp. SMC90 TaxID=2929803 RepID=UPI001FB4F3B8|nr:ATP-binding protein [Mucilaginibacter sp. SMC90]UOE47157.1 ATP-binding protein [Mucilaginibacter sp. SMC90]